MKNAIVTTIALSTILLGCTLARRAPANASDQDIRLLRKDLRSTGRTDYDYQHAVNQ